MYEQGKKMLQHINVKNIKIIMTYISNNNNNSIFNIISKKIITYNDNEEIIPIIFNSFINEILKYDIENWSFGFSNIVMVIFFSSNIFNGINNIHQLLHFKNIMSLKFYVEY